MLVLEHLESSLFGECHVRALCASTFRKRRGYNS